MTIQAFFVAAQILDLVSISLFEYNVNKKYLLNRYLSIVPDPFFLQFVFCIHISRTLFRQHYFCSCISLK